MPEREREREREIEREWEREGEREREREGERETAATATDFPYASVSTKIADGPIAVFHLVSAARPLVCPELYTYIHLVYLIRASR